MSNKCIQGAYHTILWQPSSSSAGHPLDREEVCIKCGQIIADIKWNGMYHERIENGKPKHIRYITPAAKGTQAD